MGTRALGVISAWRPDPEEAGAALDSNYEWSALLEPTGLMYKKTASPTNATPITTPSALPWAKISTAAPIAAVTIQSDLIGAFFPSAYAVVVSVLLLRTPTTGLQITMVVSFLPSISMSII
jgi:hypothetical protein